MVFTTPPDMFAKQFSYMDPTINHFQGVPGEEVSAVSTMAMLIVTEKHVHTATLVTNVRDHGCLCLSVGSTRSGRKKDQTKNGTINHPAPNKINLLPTPVSVWNLVADLSNHPNQNFVSELCNIFE